MPHGAEKFVEHGSNGGLAIRPRYAHQFEMCSGIAVERGGHLSHHTLRVGYLHKSHAFRHLCQGFAVQYSAGSEFNGFSDIGMSVGLRSFHGYKQVAGFYKA